MKQGSFRAVCLMLMVCIAAASAFGDENTINLESIVLDSFDGDSGYVWQVQASKFASHTEEESFPKLAYVNAFPSSVFTHTPENRESLRSLGVWGRFDRRGYNWIDVYPTKEGGDGEDSADPAEIPIPGRVRQIDLWVWGSNLHYRLEAYVRDHLGVVHTLDFGSIYHTGWKNLRVAVPTSIPQSKRVLPRLASLTFVKFRIWTPPTEPVNNFYVYLDHLKIYTDMFETYYDGQELGDPAHVQELWSDASGNN
jgi:hypothetical protein